MNVTYDPKADAMYIYFSDKKSTKTIELRDDLLVVYTTLYWPGLAGM